jgi:hypothetical protein
MEQGQYRSFRAVHPFDERFGVETSGLIYELQQWLLCRSTFGVSRDHARDAGAAAFGLSAFRLR